MKKQDREAIAKIIKEEGEYIISKHLTIKKMSLAVRCIKNLTHGIADYISRDYLNTRIDNKKKYPLTLKIVRSYGKIKNKFLEDARFIK